MSSYVQKWHTSWNERGKRKIPKGMEGPVLTNFCKRNDKDSVKHNTQQYSSRIRQLEASCRIKGKT